jgi:prevent-host-death family protein
MMIEVTISEVKAGFSEYVNRAAYGRERVIILSRGKPKAVMMSIEDLRRFEALEDALAAIEAIEAYEAGETIPWEQVKAELAEDESGIQD